MNCYVSISVHVNYMICNTTTRIIAYKTNVMSVRYIKIKSLNTTHIFEAFPIDY